MVKSAVGQVSSLSFTFHHSPFTIQRCPRPNAAQRGFHPSSVGRFFSFIHHSLFTVQKCLHPNAHPLPFILHPFFRLPPSDPPNRQLPHRSWRSSEVCPAALPAPIPRCGTSTGRSALVVSATTPGSSPFLRQAGSSAARSNRPWSGKS